MRPLLPLALALLLLASPRAQAQSAADSVYERPNVVATLVPDAPTALRFLRMNTRHPVGDRRNAKVFVQVVVDTSGAVAHADVARSVSPGHDAEAVRVARLLRFTPGQAGGRAVRTRAMIPVAFDSAFAPPADFDAQSHPLPDMAAQMLPDYQVGMRALMTEVGRDARGVRAIKAGGGKVVVGFEVDARGRVGSVRVFQSASPGADSIVVQAVRETLTFEPALLSGQPVASYQTLPVTFRGGSPLSSSASEADVYDEKSVDEAPRMLPDARTAMMEMQRRMDYPADARDEGVQGRIVITFVVDERGRVANPRVIDSVDPRLARAALEAVRTLRYAPALRGGEPVSVQITLPVTFRLR